MPTPWGLFLSLAPAWRGHRAYHPPPAMRGRRMQPLRLMSFNLRRDVERDGDNRWAQRRAAVAALVRRHAPHVLGTQEGLAHQLVDLDAMLPGMARVGGCRRGDGSDEHTAILYDPRRLILVASGDLWLSDTPGEAGSRTWGNRLPRMVTWARFTDQETGHSFTVANTHLDHESAESRMRSAFFLAERLPNALLMGDFNDMPGGALHARFTSRWSDAHQADPGRGFGTFHGWTGEARDRLDWVLVPRHMRALAHRVLHEPVQGRYVSDHHPVLVEVAPILAEPPVEAAPATTA